jgi:hypothetical protein
VDTPRLTEAEEVTHGAAVGAASVRVADVDGEELDEAPGGAVAGASNQGGDLVKACLGELTIGGDGGHLIPGWRVEGDRSQSQKKYAGDAFYVLPGAGSRTDRRKPLWHTAFRRENING